MVEVSIFGRLVATVFSGPHPESGPERIRRALVEVDRSASAPLLLIIVKAAAQLPNADARAGYKKMLIEDDYGEEFAVAYAVLGQGFAAAAQRSVLTGLSLVTPSEIRTRVFSNVEEASAWLVEVGMSATDRDALLEAALWVD